jgi:hypothetical protein
MATIVAQAGTRVMRILAISACALVLFTGIAHSEDADEAASRVRQEQKKQKELDAAYKEASTIKKAPATTVDPWGTVRPANSSNTTAK